MFENCINFIQSRKPLFQPEQSGHWKQRLFSFDPEVLYLARQLLIINGVKEIRKFLIKTLFKGDYKWKKLKYYIP